METFKQVIYKLKNNHEAKQHKKIIGNKKLLTFEAAKACKNRIDLFFISETLLNELLRYVIRTGSHLWWIKP